MSDKTEPWTALQIAVYAINSPNTDKYADEVARLIEEYRQSSPVESKWVSVKERLPERDVFTLCNYGGMCPVIGCYKGDGKWLCDGYNDFWIAGDEIISWMLIELPPIEEPKEK